MCVKCSADLLERRECATCEPDSHLALAATFGDHCKANHATRDIGYPPELLREHQALPEVAHGRSVSALVQREDSEFTKRLRKVRRGSVFSQNRQAFVQ